MWHGGLLALLLGAGSLLTAGCDATDAGVPDPRYQDLRPGDPLPGLTEEQEVRFRQGHALFQKIFTPEEGLGPLFNENACNACHTDPADGGTGDQFLQRAAHFTENGGCDLLLDEGGDNLRQQVTPALAAHGVEGDTVPGRANATGRFDVPFVFGLGLVEAIPEATILSREDPEDRNRDGVSGRASRDEEGRVLRFGRKAHIATLLEFNEEAARLEMGLTTPMNPEEVGPNRGAVMSGTDPAADPEVDMETLELLTDFVRFLAPVSRILPEDPDELALVERGERLFDEIGCSACHRPSMETGPHEVEALDRKRVHLYSDLLLHDMGPTLADVCGPDAGTSELRTEMLMGLSYRNQFLHDGRARSLQDAIELHGGEASRARDRFLELSWGNRGALIRFLDTL
ncbi:MAG: di-heme oxidoredictase family protein [bacterium]